MFKKSSEMVTDIIKNMRGGKGEVEMKHIYKQDELTGKARIFAQITLNPGCSIGLHEHAKEEEIYYILEGSGVVDDNGQMREINTGDALLTGGGKVHSIENTGKVPLVLMAVVLLF